MARRKGLGRGLDSLIPQEPKAQDAPQEGILRIPLDKIRPRESQPRKLFDEESLKDLAKSIEEHGVLQPILVKTTEDGYEIVAGERRYRASVLAKQETIPAFLSEHEEKEAQIISVIENIQREDLNPWEEALAYQELIEEYGLTQQELADQIGKTRSHIANTLRLLQLDEESLKALKDGKLTSTQARTLLSIADLEERKKYRELLMNRAISVNEVEKRGTKRKKRKKKDLFVRDWENRAQEALGTKVNLSKSANRWRIQIDYYSPEELEYFLDRIGDFHE